MRKTEGIGCDNRHDWIFEQVQAINWFLLSCQGLFSLDHLTFRANYAQGLLVMSKQAFKRFYVRARVSTQNCVSDYARKACKQKLTIFSIK